MSKSAAEVANELKNSLLAENAVLLNRFTTLHQEVNDVLNNYENIDDNIEELLKAIDNRLENLIDKTEQLNETLS